ncbi:Cytochrome P450 monooxygenase azaI [Apiospora hydei]|uniref:Cytochrome P450 monooxygenase azaI n=1 Tax=Apiospora hydei TaxID=1337664 RepID=A0ABR1W998_9PEZI
MELLSTHPAYIGLVGLALGLFAYLFSAVNGPLAKLPGPWYSHFTELVGKYHLLNGRKPTYIDELHDKYGPIVRTSPHEVSVKDVASMQRMYSVKGEFPKTKWYQQLVNVVSVFSTSNIALHRRYRRLLSGAMSETGLLRHKQTIEGKVRMAIQRMGEETQRHGVTDILFWSMCMTTDIIAELSFGQSFNQLETGEKNEYMRNLAAIGSAQSIRISFPILTKLSPYIPFPIPFIRKGTEVFDRTQMSATELLRRHYRVVEEEGEDVKPTLLSKLYHPKAGEEGLEFDEVVANSQSYIVAGSDTTSNTLTYLIWSVLKHHEVRRKLMDELDTLPDSFEDSDLKKLPYLNAVIEETLRLYSSVPAGLPRAVPPEGIEFCGHWIPGGTTVSAQAYTMHRNPVIYPNPLKFDPSRWEKPTQGMKDSFVPFGGGSRVCMGLHLARMELRLATSRFFLTFRNARISAADGFCDEDMEPNQYFLMTPKKQRCLIEVI